MFRQNQNVLTALFSRFSGSASGNHSPLRVSKPTRRRADRQSRTVCPEQLESRQLLTGLSFESVITTERNYPVGASFAHAVAADVAGNTYLGGSFQGTVDFDRNAVHSGNEDILTARGYSDAFVVKYDPSGQFLWARRMGGDSTKSSDDTGYGIATDNSGNVFLTGNFGDTADFGGNSLTSVGLRDSFLAKLDPTGDFLWTKELGTEVDESTSQIVIDEGGSVAVATLSSAVGQATTRIRQFDTNGTQLWVHEVGANAFQLRADASGDFYVAGNVFRTVDLDPGPGEYLVTGSTTARKNFVSKISNSGEFQWATSLVWDPSDYASSFQMVSSIAVGNDGSIALMGSYSAGEVRIEQGNSVISFPSFASTRAFFTLLDTSTGAFQTVKAYDGNFRSASLVATSSGYAATGITDGAGVFNPVPGISLAGLGSNDVFLMTLDQTGDVSWAGLVGGTSAL